MLHPTFQLINTMPKIIHFTTGTTNYHVTCKLINNFSYIQIKLINMYQRLRVSDP